MSTPFFLWKFYFYCHGAKPTGVGRGYPLSQPALTHTKRPSFKKTFYPFLMPCLILLKCFESWICCLFPPGLNDSKYLPAGSVSPRPCNIFTSVENISTGWLESKRRGIWLTFTDCWLILPHFCSQVTPSHVLPLLLLPAPCPQIRSRLPHWAFG